MKNLFKKTDVTNYDGSSEHLKKEQSLKKTIDIRLKIFMMVLVGLASVLVYRLYQIQIVDADHYIDLLEKSHIPSIGMATMRGEFFDRNGEVLVSNKPINSITYYPPSGVDAEERWKVAQNIVKSFKVEDDLTEGDLKNLWLYLNENGKSLITDKEVEEYKDNKLSEKDIDYLKQSRITKEMMDSLSENDRKTFKIFYAMGTSTASQSAIVLEEATEKDIAYLSENKDLFPGFSFITNWEREHNKKIGLSSLIGNVSDISSEKLDYYLADGYQLNDKVGSYGLEYQYEDLLSGVKSHYSIDGSDRQLNMIKEGRKGYDLNMSLDFKLQQDIEKVLQETMESVKNDPRRKPFKEMQMVVSDPRTGDVLGLAAMKRDDKGKYYNDPQTLMLDGFPLGSTIKGATVYMGLDQGVMKQGEIINDTPMYIAGTPPRHSFMNLGPVDDIKSLQLSSNIYMFEVAMRLGGYRYVPNAPLRIENPDDTYQLMRNYYSQFGLGVKTQIDYPREELAFKGSTEQAGSLLDFSIGQFDNYNAMQLNQYIATLANGGYRLKPRLVREAVSRDNQSVVYENQVEILNTLENEEATQRVREGMRRCVITGNCGPIMSASYTSGAKTGTAQDYLAEYNGVVRHNTFVAFAPFDNPEIAVSCIAPYTYLESGGGALTNLCSVATKKVMDNYMNSR
ncbi:penicillin-binding protein 2 [Erysipelothrix urinaevulpis]|uniref:peptidoglycan D,D-transpeptidase FtsI family protein n=1 Tax=Erysipelothrix urinaevulpis TaxID=2683717 RepID=UPI001F326ACA|nr:penicillin-binding transpeptidase domain-containing protein [Erysipelothrix urinaevulpis]